MYTTSSSVTSSSSTYMHTSSGYIPPPYSCSFSSSSCIPTSSLIHTATSSACEQLSSSSMDWSAPRISFSTDFSRAGTHSVPHETMKEISDSPARLSSSKSSPSEFEFSMSIQGPDRSYDNRMLAADELFYEGKLLPLYNNPQGAHITEPIISRRRSSAEEYTTLTHADHLSELGRVGVEQNPISPKAPTCTSRWRELLGLKKVHIQDANNGGKLQRKSSYPGNGLAPGRRSVDTLKDPKRGALRFEARIHHCVREPKPNLSQGECHTHHSVRETKPSFSVGEARMHAVEAQNHENGTHLSSVGTQSECSIADPGLCSTTNLQTRGMSGSRSSKSSEDSEDPVVDVGQATKQRSMVKSPTKQSEQARVNGMVATSPRRGGGGLKWMSPGHPSVAESSRSAIATRLVVRGLDRSYSNPKPTKKRPDQLRSSRPRTSTDGSRSLERSTSYSAGVRVTPVINVPMYITPGIRKGSKNGIFSFFSSKKDKSPYKLSSSASHHHHTHGDG